MNIKNTWQCTGQKTSTKNKRLTFEKFHCLQVCFGYGFHFDWDAGEIA